MRRHLALIALIALLTMGAEVTSDDRAIDASRAKVDEGTRIHWYDFQLLDVEGQGWTDTKAAYDRLPARAEKAVRPSVFSLSRHSAGICARFVTDAQEIHVRWTLRSARLAMPHMPATGVSGVDLYAKSDAGQWRWLAVGRPTAQSNSVRLVAGLRDGKREYLIYLPLYNGVETIEVGLPDGKSLAKGSPRPESRRKPLVFYGTSITHGACASRPGMAHTSILGRWLDRPVINLGFSGNGTMDEAVAHLMGEIDAAAYIIDCLPNLRSKEVTERTGPLVRVLRAARPNTPILLVEDRNYPDSFLVASKRERNGTNQAALRAVYNSLKEAGISGLHYLEGGKLLGDDGEDTVDSSHPTDLGFLRQAKAFRDVLVPIVGTRVRVAAISFVPKKFDLEGNAAKLERSFRAARAGGAKIAVAPEGALDGYVVNEVIARKADAERVKKIAVEIDGPLVRRFRLLARELSLCLVFGFAEKIGDDVFNCAVFIDDSGRVCGKYHKMQFAEGYHPSWWFNRLGRQSRAFDTPYGRCGVLICNDRWNPQLARIPVLDGAQFLVIPAFGSRSKSQDEAVLSRARESGVPIVEANVGVTLIVDGGVVTAVDRDETKITFGSITVPPAVSANSAERDRVEAEFLDWRKKEMKDRYRRTVERLGKDR